MNETSLQLRAGDLQLALAPAFGGAIAGFRHAGFALLRETPHTATDVRHFSCYPLVPFSNRIAGGRLTFAGHSYQLRRDPVTGGAHAIHGEGWQHPWSIAEASRSSARLVFEHPGTTPESWPFPFRAEQLFVLTECRLEITLIVGNAALTPQPVGFGLHPYFPRHNGVTLGFGAASVWQNGADHLPSTCTAVPPGWDFSQPRALEDPELDNCFAGWAGTAAMTWPSAGPTLRISADRSFAHAVVYTPANSDSFAFEPVSHMNDAINRLDVPGRGLVTLPPGGTLTGTVRFLVAATSSG